MWVVDDRRLTPRDKTGLGIQARLIARAWMRGLDWDSTEPWTPRMAYLWQRIAMERARLKRRPIRGHAGHVGVARWTPAERRPAEPARISPWPDEPPDLDWGDDDAEPRPARDAYPAP